MGKSGYIWCFCNKHIAFFHHDHSRAAAVIEKILGTDFKGIVICDFYAAYNTLGKTQRCLVHLLRDIKKERDVLQSSTLLKQFESPSRNPHAHKSLSCRMHSGHSPNPAGEQPR